MLVVEDFADARAMFCELLASEGFRTAVASDGATALSKARSLRPHAIVLDLSLPRVSGWEVARRLKDDPDTKGITIVAVTAHVHDLSLRRARSAGCDRILAKPVRPDALTAELRALLAPRRSGGR